MKIFVHRRKTDRSEQNRNVQHRTHTVRASTKTERNLVLNISTKRKRGCRTLERKREREGEREMTMIKDDILDEE